MSKREAKKPTFSVKKTAPPPAKPVVGPKESKIPLTRRFERDTRHKGQKTLDLSNVKRLMDDVHKRFNTKELDEETQELFNSEMSGISSLLVDPNQVYAFRLVYQDTISSTAGGALIGALSWALPSTLLEYTSYFVNMFAECKLSKIRLNLVPFLYTKSTHAPSPVVFGSNLAYAATVPASVQEVLDCADSTLVPSNAEGGGGFQGKFEKTTHTPDYYWALTSAPAADRNAGLFGQFSYSVIQNGPALTSARYYAYTLEAVILFKGRL